MKTLYLYLIFIFFCSAPLLFAQKVDSLRDKPNEYFEAKLNEFDHKRGDTLVWVYLNAYIENAKRKKDFETLYYAYTDAAYYSDKQQKIIYMDSAQITAKKTNDQELLAEAYLTKGIAYYTLKKYKEALDNYIDANEIFSKSKDKYSQNKTTVFIAAIKNYLGYYDDALVLLQSACDYFKQYNDAQHQIGYLRSLYEIGIIYQKIGQYQKATDNNLLGLQESIKFDEKIQEHYFTLAIGVDDYFAKNYAHTIQNINKALPRIIENKSFDLEAKGYFYLAKSYLALKQEEKALANFQKIDSLFVENEYLSPQFRESYEWLIDHYKKADDKDQQLYYINQLLEVDKINADNSQYLAYKIHKEYDTQKLLETKKELEQRFANWQYYAMGISFLLLIVSAFFFLNNRHVRRKNRSLKKQYDDLINAQQAVEIPEVTIAEVSPKATKEIPQEVVEDLLKRLEKFEQNQEFLKRNIDQKNLADKFKTNTAYLSKIINTYKGTNFSGYLNKLRINYVIDLLKHEPKCRNYTIEALSELSGFASSRQFSDVFLAETGLRPTYFLEQIRKEKDLVLG